mmetsp:Transcript_31063/g.41234  ORF Transcript_31063/g.41234 Transcript_31063/m.41234 type:complete len:512 (-) Transcript_31063:606-2141(-)
MIVEHYTHNRHFYIASKQTTYSRVWNQSRYTLSSLEIKAITILHIIIMLTTITPSRNRLDHSATQSSTTKLESPKSMCRSHTNEMKETLADKSSVVYNKDGTKKRSSMIVVPMAWITCGLFLFVFATLHGMALPSSSFAIVSNGTSSSNKVLTSLSAWRRRKNSAMENKEEEEAQAQARQETQKKERGKQISASITAEELYEAYTQIRDEYNDKAFHPKSEKSWNVLKSTSDGIEISMLHHASDPNCPYVRMKAIMPGSIQETWEFLELKNWDKTMPKMDPFYEGLETLGTYSIDASAERKRVSKNKAVTANKSTKHVFRDDKVQMILARKRTNRILAFGKRDFTFVSVSDLPRLEDNVWVSGTVSVVTSKFPRQKGYTRAFQDSVAFYEELPLNEQTGDEQTSLTIVCRIDLNDSSDDGQGGFVPMWIYAKTIGLSGVLSINNMRKELVRMKEEMRSMKIIQEEMEGQSKKDDDDDDERDGQMRIPLVPWVKTGGNREGSNVADNKDESI